MLRLVTGEVKTCGPPHSGDPSDVENVVISVELDRDESLFLNHGQLTARERIHVEPFEPLRCGAGCENTFLSWNNSMAWRSGGKEGCPAIRET